MKLSRAQVKDLQDALRRHGYKPGRIDGILGRNTENAIKAFQKDNDLAQNGTVTNETLIKMGFNGGKAEKTKIDP